VRKIDQGFDLHSNPRWVTNKIPHPSAEFSSKKRFGSDEVQYRNCNLWSAFKIDYHIVVSYWLQQIIGGANPDSQSHNHAIPKINVSKVEGWENLSQKFSPYLGVVSKIGSPS